MKQGTRIQVQTEDGPRLRGTWVEELPHAARPAARVQLEDGTLQVYPRGWVFRDVDVRKAWIFEHSRVVRLIFWQKTNGLTLGPCIFLRGAARPRLLRHELTHVLQGRELLYVGFFLLYLLFIVWGFLRTRNVQQTYRGIPFEREAHLYDDQPGYLYTRKRWAWWRYARD